MLLIASFVAPIVVGAIFKSDILEITTSIVALLVAVLFAKAKIEGYFLLFLSLTLYAIVSWRARLYGEFIDQIILTLPVAIFGVVNWLRNKFDDTRKGKVVKITHTHWIEIALLILSQIIMGVGYYFVLRAFNTNLLLLSTICVAVAFMGTYLTARRSDFVPYVWILSDFALIALWAFVGAMVILPIVYVIIDTYSIINWRRLKKCQK